MLQFLICLHLLLPIQGNVLIEYPHDFISVDQLGNVFIIDDTEIVKFNSKGEKITSFSNSMLGSVSGIDVSNPLRILVFYKDFNQILFLDRNLAEIGNEIDLYEYSCNETELVCSSSEGGFWMYNPDDNQANHISKHGNLLNKSILLNSFYEETIPDKILEYRNDLFLLFPGMGILNLDHNGQFKKKISIPGIKEFQIFQNTILYTNESGVFSFQPFKKKDKLRYQPESTEEEKKIIIRNDKIYISNKKSISIKPLTP